MSGPERPTLEQVIKNAIRAGLLDTHTSFPGKVVAYDASKQQATIKPLLKKKFLSNNETVDIPDIKNVPVFTYSGDANSFIYVPIKVGCIGMVNICERSIDSWLAGDGQGFEPDDPRHHDISDAWFVPGVRPFKKALVVTDTDSIIIKNGSLTVTIDPAGKISMQGVSNELLATIDTLFDDLLNAKVVTMLGAQPFTTDTIVALTATKAKLTTLLRS